jgi:hypothetical protein
MNNHHKVINLNELNAFQKDVKNQIIFIQNDRTSSEEEIIRQYQDQISVAYMSTNWDSLQEALCDCDWMSSEHVYIIQEGLPNLSDTESDTYFKILKRAADIHRIGPTQNFQLPQKKIDFHVIFLARNEIEKHKLEKRLA